ncbi:CDP-diacylglycerol--serine O-phosphatidyltransferase [Ferrimonas balearica]|uniref:CDP-diacylglycerol--serine O-phosphatidyltransferase n=1 Tax=Ferrimonas balearica TaxID=44012 RepID=UPI001C99D7D7|nr:CDP-diacylglycerol--serine O-phosphatidyltransferase [Ferrimonas balearica]MBY5920378.1 CDP-diacylglycerol--serine O-phosphatidyltransferase [Ferrimonas balearica]MBY5996937.1 CDP-diacylglycerol--serine O-phosphatidyltransferase [Ferrimonas balearica]
MASTSKYHWLAGLASQSLSPEQVEIITDTRCYRERLLQLIASARHRIYIAALYLQEDAAGREVLHALYQAKQQRPELDVQVLVDFHRAQRGLIGKGPQVGNDQFYRDTAAEYPDVSIGIYGVPVKNREWAGVLHLKGFVIDDTVVYSGASINDVYMGVGERYRYDRYHLIHNAQLADSMLAFIRDELIASPAVVSLLHAPVPSAKVLRREIKAFKHHLSRARYQLPKGDDDSDLRVIPLLGLGRQGNLLNRTIVRLLKSAEREAFICTPYFNLPSQLTQTIGRLLKQGVRVTIVVGDKTANDFYIKPDEPFSPVGGLPYLYEQNLKRFAKRHQRAIDSGLLNLQLWWHNDNSYHLKGIQVDDDAYLLTGNNLNPRAWALDLENGLLITDPEARLKDRFDEERACILEHTKRVENFQDLESVDDYPTPVAKLLKRLNRVKADLLLKRLL